MPVLILRDLRIQFGGARDQDQRPTCLAFAASDTHAALRSPWAPLSVEFLFYHAQRRSGRTPHVGATLPAMLEAMKKDGQPIEAGWPYLAAIPSDWQPAAAVGTLYRRRSEESGFSFEEIIERLDEGRPVLMLMMLSAAFDFANSSGGVVDQNSGEEPNSSRRHAVVAVAHGLLAEKKVVLVRNSWGEDWGEQGYAWLTEAYLTPRVFRIGILTENPDVPSRSATV